MNSLEIEVLVEQAGNNCTDLLAAASGLSKGRIKDAMQKGAVWLIRGNHQRRLRRVKSKLKAGERIKLYYDPAILEQIPPEPILIHDAGDYSVWRKPSMMLSSGSRFGDHCAMARWIEMNFKPQRSVFLVHRLDRAASGVMVFAHTKRTAAKLSEAFRLRQVDKYYAVLVTGELADSGTIDSPLDAKQSISHYLPVSYNQASNCTELQVQIETGRKHQIRRHLASIGHPVLGDRLYGTVESTGLALVSKELSFTCPVRGEKVTFAISVEFDQMNA
jgi:tRNA pseudouridine32 synthase/23S rRNA pseudouridine746 synthase